MGKLQERAVLLEPWFSIYINGKKLGEDMTKYVESVEVEDEDEKYSEATIVVADYDMKWLNGIGIGKGSLISVNMGHVKNRANVFKGKISLVDVSFPELGYPTLEVKCVDNAVALMEKSKSKTFKNMKVSDVVSAMHKKAGVKIQVESSKTVHKHIPQTKETEAEFTHRWRKKMGWKYYKKPDKSYYFGSKNLTGASKGKLGWRTGGLEIISFSPTFVDIETESDDKETQINNKNAKKVTSKNTKKKTKAKSSGGDKIAGKA